MKNLVNKYNNSKSFNNNNKINSRCNKILKISKILTNNNNIPKIKTNSINNFSSKINNI